MRKILFVVVLAIALATCALAQSGAGLGLSLVKSLIELHGGSIAISSEPGSGTTILCRLPARLRLPAQEPAASRPAV